MNLNEMRDATYIDNRKEQSKYIDEIDRLRKKTIKTPQHRDETIDKTFNSDNIIPSEKRKIIDEENKRIEEIKKKN